MDLTVKPSKALMNLHDSQALQNIGGSSVGSSTSLESFGEVLNIHSLDDQASSTTNLLIAPSVSVSSIVERMQALNLTYVTEPDYEEQPSKDHEQNENGLGITREQLMKRLGCLVKRSLMEFDGNAEVNKTPMEIKQLN